MDILDIILVVVMATLVIWHSWRVRNRSLKIVILPDLGNVKLWMRHLEDEIQKENKRGEKALANPWDSLLVIPTNQELPAIVENIRGMGLGANLYTNFSDDTTPHHLTVHWG